LYKIFRRGKSSVRQSSTSNCSRGNIRYLAVPLVVLSCIVQFP
jgi:hypothetical protein